MEIKDVQTMERISTHSHITGLGEINGRIEYNRDGLVGQLKARRAMLMVKRLIETNQSSRAILVKGEPGTGKTALAIGLSKSLGFLNFTTISGAEIYSLNMSKCESLTQALRRSIGVKIREKIKVIEGEVVSVASRKIVLKTIDMESSFDIGTKMRQELERIRVSVGDIIRIIKDKTKVYKVGTSTIKNDVVGLDTKFVPCPEGELLKIVDDIQNVSLHDIDVISNRAQGYLALFSGETGEIKAEVRDDVNKKVIEWVNEGKAEIQKGVLFIDEVHMLDVESFAYLNKMVEDKFCPIIIMSSNKEKAFAGEEDETREFGVPKDFLDRSLAISTEKYDEKDLKEIFKIRAYEEDVKIEDKAIDRLVSLVQTSGLRYALNILTISNIRASKRHSSVQVDDIARVCELFLDEKKGVEAYNRK